jgi:acyl-CoA thioester hydrolase
MTIEAPLQIYRDRVHPEWIDYNGHMNVAYYVLAFDYVTDAFFDYLRLGHDYLKAANCSTFAVEMNVSYVREVHEGDPLAFRTWLLGHDHKRLHYYHEMYHADEGWLAAGCELMSLHIDMSIRRTAPFPNDVMAWLGEVAAAHAAIPQPERVGRKIAMPGR